MATDDEITTVQSFTARTLKYGRNMTAVAVPIIVFAFLPVVNLAKSRPLNLYIEPGGEFWIWVIFLTLLGYYGFRFIGLAIPDFLVWRRLHGNKWGKLKAEVKSENSKLEADQKLVDKAHKNHRNNTNPNRVSTLREIQNSESAYDGRLDLVSKTQFNLKDYIWRRIYFWMVDAGLPSILFGAAIFAVIIKIYCFWPSDTLCTPNPHIQINCSPPATVTVGCRS